MIIEKFFEDPVHVKVDLDDIIQVMTSISEDVNIDEVLKFIKDNNITRIVDLSR